MASAVRAGLRQTAAVPASPHTPTRAFSSNFSSPGTGFRQEEEAVIFELGSRYLRAGFEGEALPQCCVTVGPETSRRVGDYRDWESGFTSKLYKLGAIDAWARQHEFWQNDLGDYDIGLFEDRLERAIRDVFNKYLLTDAGSQRLCLVLPSLMPHPLLSSLLTLLFNRWAFPTISLLPSPSMAAVAAGQRSALVVDIGWQETTITTIYEYRETSSLRSTRAMKQVVRAMAEILYSSETGNPPQTKVDFDFAEEMIIRLGWCKSKKLQSSADNIKSNETGIDPVIQTSTAIGEATITSRTSESQDIDPTTTKLTGVEEEEMVEIDLPNRAQTTPLKLPLSTFNEPIESVLFASTTTYQDLDDEELPLPLLIFRVLASLDPDVRGICMSRIVFVGGGSQIHDLPQRTLDEVEQLALKHGWSKVRGAVIDKQREKLQKIDGNSASRIVNKTQDPELDPIDERLRRTKLKENPSPVQGVLRSIDSLGSWTGASLLASIKTRGIVEVDRDRFLQHGGLAGAHREEEVSILPQRQSFGPAMRAAADRSSWTLAGWG